jgi:hypothetical protein
VYFSPECHANYQALGFAGSRGVQDGVAMPDRSAYFTSRGSVMGQVSGQVVTATFAVFNPEVVIPAVEQGWALTDAATICDARDRGAIAQLERILGTTPEGIDRVNEILLRAYSPLRAEGRALFAGLKGLQMPTTPIGKLWRLTDALREYRGDSHIAAWISHGLDAVELCLLTDAFSGLPLRTYSATRGWRDTDFDSTQNQAPTPLLGVNVGRSLKYTPTNRHCQQLQQSVTTTTSCASCLPHGVRQSRLWADTRRWARTKWHWPPPNLRSRRITGCSLPSARSRQSLALLAA